MRELKLNGESETPTLHEVLEFAGKRMGPCARIDSACKHKEINSTYEGAQPIDDLVDDHSVEAVARTSYAKEQTGKFHCAWNQWIRHARKSRAQDCRGCRQGYSLCLCKEEERLLQARSRQ